MIITKVDASPEAKYYDFEVDEANRTVKFTYNGKSITVKIPETVAHFEKLINVYRNEAGNLSEEVAEYHVAQLIIPISAVHYEEGEPMQTGMGEEGSEEPSMIQVLETVPLEAVELRIWPIV